MFKRIVTVVCLMFLVLAALSLDSHAAKRKKRSVAKATKKVETSVMPKHSFSINPLTPLLSPIFPIEYEYTLTPKSTLAGHVGFGGYSLGSDWSTTIIGFGGAYRFFLLKDKEAPAGLWVGPAADFMIVSASYKYLDIVWDPTIYNYRTTEVEETGTSLFVSFGGEVGHEWLFKDLFDKGVHFTVSPSLFLGFMIGSLELADSSLSLGGFAFGLGCSVGVAF